MQPQLHCTGLPAVGRVGGYSEFGPRWVNAQEDIQAAAARLTGTLACKSCSGARTRIDYVAIDSFFQHKVGDDTYLQLVDPWTGQLVYMDFSHVNTVGVERLEQVFRKELFGEHVCP